jgi:hypothetical protein
MSLSQDDSLDRSEYSEGTLDVANQVFFIMQEHEDPPDLLNKFEHLRQKKYSYGIQSYAYYLLAPEILLETPEAERLASVLKAMEMLMMIYLKQSAARDSYADEYVYNLSPKLFWYRANRRNKSTIRNWNHPNREEEMPRILKKLIQNEAKAFLTTWSPLGFDWSNQERWTSWWKIPGRY